MKSYIKITNEIQHLLSDRENILKKHIKYKQKEIQKLKRWLKKGKYPYNDYLLNTPERENIKKESQFNGFWIKDYKKQLKILRKIDICLDITLKNNITPAVFSTIRIDDRTDAQSNVQTKVVEIQSQSDVLTMRLQAIIDVKYLKLSEKVKELAKEAIKLLMLHSL